MLELLLLVLRTLRRCGSVAPRYRARKSGPPPSASGRLAHQPASPPAGAGSSLLGLASPPLAWGLATAPSDGATRDGLAVAPEGLAALLDVEVADQVRSAPPQQGAHRTNLAGKPPLGDRTHPGRVAQTRDCGNRSIRRYRCRRLRPPGNQRWRTFLSNQLRGIWAADLFVVQTVSFPIINERQLHAVLAEFAASPCDRMITRSNRNRLTA